MVPSLFLIKDLHRREIGIRVLSKNIQVGDVLYHDLFEEYHWIIATKDSKFTKVKRFKSRMSSKDAHDWRESSLWMDENGEIVKICSVKNGQVIV